MTRFYFLLVSLLFISGCKNPSEQIILENESLLKALDISKAKGKGLILLSSTSACVMCDQFESLLIKNENLGEEVAENFVILRVNINAAGGEWLSRILNKGSFPIFLFFDKSGGLRHIDLGALNKRRLEDILKNIQKTSLKTMNKLYSLDRQNKLSEVEQISYVQTLCDSQVKWDKFSRDKDTLGFAQVIKRLAVTSNYFSSFYNNYLISKMQIVSADSLNAKKYALKALEVDDISSYFLNAALRTEMKMILNRDYNLLNEAYIGINNTTCDFGKVKPGMRIVKSFVFTNIGKEPLKIDTAFSDCGCTVPSYPKYEILPGNRDSFTVSFKGRSFGEFTHMVQLVGNASNAPLQLTIKGVVIPE